MNSSSAQQLQQPGHSTGPRSATGKATVAKNALKTGMTALTNALLPGEDPVEVTEMKRMGCPQNRVGSSCYVLMTWLSDASAGQPQGPVVPISRCVIPRSPMCRRSPFAAFVALLLNAFLLYGSSARADGAKVTIPICSPGFGCINVDAPWPLNDAETDWCNDNPVQADYCLLAYGMHAYRGANDAQDRLLPVDGSETRKWDRDAFRHCYWSARMRINWGFDMAFGFTDRHENWPNNPVSERTMDVQNNAIGFQVGVEAINNRGTSLIGDPNQERYVYAENGCFTQVQQGRLNVIRKNAWGQVYVTQPALGTIAYREVLKLMPVGDSITHGKRGDFTWRYRLHEHLRTSGVFFDFVGPNIMALDRPGEQPAPYAVSGWDSAHDSWWGRSASSEADEIRERVALYQPDILLIDLGTNDLTWGRNPTATPQHPNIYLPPQVAERMRTLIARAWEANPKIDVALAKIGRTGPMLAAAHAEFNQLLGQLAVTENRVGSEVRIADVSALWNYTTDAYDQTHPNVRGDYVIAKAFADTLSTGFGYGRAFGDIPLAAGPPKPAGIVISPNTVRRNQAFTVSWPRVVNPGIWTEYKVQVRYHQNFGFGVVWESATTANTSIAYNGPALPQAGTYHVVVIATDGTQQTMSDPVNLNVSDGPAPPPAPTNVRLAPSTIGRDSGFIASWDRVVNSGVWTEYKLQVRYHSGFGFGLIWQSPTTTTALEATYAGPRFPQAGIFHVVVVARDSYGQETMSAPVELTVLESAPPPLAPANVRLSPDTIWRTGRFTVEWNRVPNLNVWTEYKVQVRNHQAFGFGLIWEAPSTPNLSVTYGGPAFTQDGTYAVVVVARDWFGKETMSAPIPLYVVTNVPPPPPPVITQVAPNPIGRADAFTASWTRTQQPGVWTEYKLQLRNHQNFGFGVIWTMPATTTATSAKYTGPALPQTGIYSLVVIARDSYGHETMGAPVNLTVDH